MAKDSLQKIRLEDYQPFEYLIPHISMVFQLDADKTIVKSKLKCFASKNHNAPIGKIILDGENLEIIEIKIDNHILSTDEYIYENNKLILDAPSEQFEISTIVAISPIANKALSGLYSSSDILCTQCEAEGFRRITFWPDRPDVLSKFFVRLEADKEKYPTLLANGNPVSLGDYGDGRHFVEWDDPWPKPSYLFALVAGELSKISDSFVTSSGRDIELNIYVEKQDIERVDYAMDSLKRSMKWDEENYNREYDLDVFNIVGVRDFNAGAMENKGLNIFNSALLVADQQTATDFDFANIERVVAHEYFHNWSGNRVTCRDWFQLSLKEGLTVFRDQEFSADQRSRPVQRIQDVVQLRARQFAEDAGPNSHSVRPHEYASIDNFYTSTIYEKGAEIIRVANNILGDNDFFAGAINYFETNDGKAATIEDWLKALRETSGNALEGIEKWYSQAGTPIVEVKTTYKDKIFSINLKQWTPLTPNQPQKEWVPIPIKVAFFDKNGNRISLKIENQHIDIIHLNFTSNEFTITFDDVAEKPILSFLRGFTAPVKVITDHTDEELAILAAHDNDHFVRWESLQTIARKEILSGYQKLEKSDDFIPSNLLLSAYKNVLKIARNDLAYAALLLQLPSTNDLIQAVNNAKPELIFKAREILAAEIYKNNKDEIKELIAEYDFNAPFSPNAINAGKRAFVASCFYLTSFGENNGALLLDYFNNTNNMTDKMSLLFALARIGDDNWQKALAKFYGEWSDNGIVLDKWFSNQAANPANDPIGRLKDLLAHKDFIITNPNRVRSVLASFAISNPVAFNDPSGAGYKIVTDKLLELDKINPMVAARVATAFERVVKLAPDRRKLAKEMLENLLSEKTSTQLQEIVSGIAKSL